MKQPAHTPMLKVIWNAMWRELDKGGFVSLKKLIYAARYSYCEERLWRKVQEAEKDLREGRVYDSLEEGLKALQK